ncbi:hypothetical protein RFI_30247, partial [Reticulomyxa filosa]
KKKDRSESRCQKTKAMRRNAFHHFCLRVQSKSSYPGNGDKWQIKNKLKKKQMQRLKKKVYAYFKKAKIQSHHLEQFELLMHCIRAKKQSLHFVQPHHWFNGDGRSCNNDHTPSLHNVDADTDASADIGVAFGDADDDNNNNDNDDNSNGDKNCNDHNNGIIHYLQSLKPENLLSFCCPFPIFTEAALFIFLLAYFHLCVIEI